MGRVRRFIKKRPADEIKCPPPRTPQFNVEEPAAAGGSGKFVIKNAQTFKIISGIVTYINIEIGGSGGAYKCSRWVMGVFYEDAGTLQLVIPALEGEVGGNV